jgi:hypothetical protein
MSFSNLWDLYISDDLDDDRRSVEEYIIDYEVEDNWPEYEIPKEDIVLNKEALLAIKLAQPRISIDEEGTNSNEQQEQQQQQLPEGDGLLKEAQSAGDNDKIEISAKNNLISNNINRDTAATAYNNNEEEEEEEGKKIDGMQQKNKGSLSHKRVTITTTTTTADNKESVMPPDSIAAAATAAGAATKHTIDGKKDKIITADDTMTILLISCIVIWLLFQLKVNICLFLRDSLFCQHRLYVTNRNQRTKILVPKKGMYSR